MSLADLENQRLTEHGFVVDPRERSKLIAPSVEPVTRRLIVGARPLSKEERSRASDLKWNPRYLETVVLPSLQFDGDRDVLVVLENSHLELRFLAAIPRSRFPLGRNNPNRTWVEGPEDPNPKSILVRVFRPMAIGADMTRDRDKIRGNVDREEVFLGALGYHQRVSFKDQKGRILATMKGILDKDIKLQDLRFLSQDRWDLTSQDGAYQSDVLAKLALVDLPRSSELLGLPPIEVKGSRLLMARVSKSYDFADPDQLALWLIAKGLHQRWPSGAVDFDVTAVPVHPRDRDVVVPGKLRWSVQIQLASAERVGADPHSLLFRLKQAQAGGKAKHEDVFELPYQTVSWIGGSHDSSENTGLPSAGEFIGLSQLPGGSEFLSSYGARLSNYLHQLAPQKWVLDEGFLFHIEEPGVELDGSFLLRVFSERFQAFEYLLFHPSKNLAQFGSEILTRGRSADLFNFSFLSDLDPSKMRALSSGFSIQIEPDETGASAFSRSTLEVTKATHGSHVVELTPSVLGNLSTVIAELEIKNALAEPKLRSAQQILEEWPSQLISLLGEVDEAALTLNSDLTLERLSALRDRAKDLEMDLRNLSSGLVLKTEREVIERLVESLRRVDRQKVHLANLSELMSLKERLSAERSVAERALFLLANLRSSQATESTQGLDALDAKLGGLVDLASERGVFTGLEGFRSTFISSLETISSHREIHIQGNLLSLERAIALYMELESTVEALSSVVL